MGRHEEAIASIKRSQKLDPTSVNISLDVARTFYYARQFDQAIEQFLKALEMDPNIFRFSDWLSLAYEQQKHYDKAIKTQLKAMTARAAKPETMTALKNAYAASGWNGFWRKQLELTQEEARERYVSPYFMARIYARLDERDRTLEWLRKAYDRHSDYLVVLKVEPIFDPLRSDPRFKELLRDIGLASAN